MSAIRAGILLAALSMLLLCSRLSALDPSLDLTQYVHAAWTGREGFNGSTRSIVQTPDGYLWLGTEFGVVRFDGVRFVPWTPPDGQRLPSINIMTLLAGRDGTLWIGTLDGLASWNHGKLIQYAEFARQPVFSLLEDHEEAVWVGSAGKLCAIRSGRVQCDVLSGGTHDNVYYAYGNLGNDVYSLFEDSERRLWAGTQSGLWRWRPGSPQRHPRQSGMMWALVPGDRASGASSLLAVSGDYLLRQISEKTAGDYVLPGVSGTFSSYRLMRDRDGALWVGTLERGLFHVYQGKTSQFGQRDGLSGNLVNALFQDREGAVWVGTTSGLDRFREPAVETISVAQGLSGPPALSVLSSRDGSVWIGSREGVKRWYRGQITTYRPTSSSQTPRRGDGNATVREITDPGLPDIEIGSLFEDQGGRIWVTSRTGAAWFENGKFTRVNGVPTGSGNAIFADKRAGVWISSPGHGLIHVVDGKVSESIHWPWSKGGVDPRLSAVIPDTIKGGLWLGFFSKGVGYFKDGQVTASFGSNDGLGADIVWDLQMDRQGTLWVATEGGLSRLRDGRIATLTMKNGLPCDAVHWAREDDAGSWWLYTACGLVRVARSELEGWVSDPRRPIRTVVFDGADGVKMHALVNGVSPVVSKSADGKLWFAHLDGISVIDPAHVPFNQLPPPVHIEQIAAGGKIYEAAHGLRLPARVRDLSIHFTALSLLSPEKVRFRFKLEGQDEDWREVVNLRQVQYSNLPPRTYRFQVIAANNSGVWNETGDSLDFSVDPAYFQTRWFQASCAAAFLALLWVLYRYRLHQIAHEFNVRLEERVGERTRIARELHDTLLQSVQALMLHFQIGVDQLPPGETKDALEKALEKGDQAIVEGREAVHDLRSSTVVENDLAKALRSLGDELATGHSATFRLIVEGASRNLHPILRDEVYRIAREAVRNAFNHAQASHIEAEISYGEKLLRLRIRDDGRGIDPEIAAEGRTGHYGLPGMRERARNIGGQLKVWTASGAGTEIDLIIPASIAYGSSPSRRSWWHRLQPVQSVPPKQES